MKTLILFTLFCFVSFQSFTSEACRMIPLEKNRIKYMYKLIKDTPDIYLAVAESYSKEDESVSFKVTEVIRGEKKQNLTIPGAVLTDETPKDIAEKSKTDFNLHKKPVFWEQIFEGRTAFGADCRLKPTFEIGSRYLILDRQPYQPKSFELVKSLGDRWYEHVRETIYPNLKKKKKSEGAATESASDQ